MNASTVVPHRIVLTGFMGAGKSVVGKHLARELGWDFIDLDEAIARAEHSSIATIFETIGEAGFREREHRALAAALCKDSIVLALGGGAIETVANRQLLAGSPDTLLVYLEAPFEVLIARCQRQRQSEPDAPRRPVLENEAELADRFNHRRQLYESAHWTIQTTDGKPNEIAETILTQWRSHADRQPE